jgi:GNAT superfamily N-acetyltransferase
MPELIIEHSENPTEEDVSALIRSLVAFNSTQAPAEEWKSIVVFLRDQNRTIVGGLNGMTHWGWLFVKHLWVHENHRRHGYASRLLKVAESVATERGCTNAYLDTFDFQALPFYQKNGYRIYGQLEDFPKGHIRYFLEKRGLNGASAP